MKSRASTARALPRSRSRRPAPGFTLIELMVALTVGAVLTGLAVSSFKYVTNSNRLASEVNALLGDMEYARAQAIKEGLPVTICTSTNGTSCAGTTTWQFGWIVFDDPNGNKTVDAGEQVRRYQRQLQLGDTFTANNAISAITFSREGFALGLPGTILITLHDTTANTQSVRCLQATIVGQLSVKLHGQSGCT